MLLGDLGPLLDAVGTLLERCMDQDGPRREILRDFASLLEPPRGRFWYLCGTFSIKFIDSLDEESTHENREKPKVKPWFSQVRHLRAQMKIDEKHIRKRFSSESRNTSPANGAFCDF